VLLAPTVWLLSGTHPGLDSISISYWTDARDVFVGALVAVGFFLSAYNGSGQGRDLEFWLSKVACVLALCVAFFPTTGFGDAARPPSWTVWLASLFGTRPPVVHYTAAVLLFVALIFMLFVFSARARSKGKVQRALLYRAIGVLMGGGIVVLGALGWALEWRTTVLIVEIWGLTLFGFGWLLAGMYRTEPGLVGSTARPGMPGQGTP
jgi:hypothetical protein